MKKIIYLYLLAFAFFSTAYAATVEVKWSEPDSYRDIHHGDDFKKSYREWVFFHFEKHFTKLAEDLPETQHLVIEVLNLDLAGDVHYGGIKLRRIIMARYYPRMEVRYELLDAEKEKIKSEHAFLKDTGFMYRGDLRYKNKALGYERKMIDDWFKKTFLKKLDSLNSRISVYSL